jgi:hypothetical protein
MAAVKGRLMGVIERIADMIGMLHETGVGAVHREVRNLYHLFRYRTMRGGGAQSLERKEWE